MKKLLIYEYAKCSTCRNALKFLDTNKVAYERAAILDTPPTRAELKKMLAAQGGNVKKLFNTSGEAYREMKLGAKLDSMSVEQALDLLSSNGRLVKRPFVLVGDTGMVGFHENEWKTVLAGSKGSRS